MRLDDPDTVQLDHDFRSRWRSSFERFASTRDDDAGIAGWSTSGLAARVRAFRRLFAVPPPGTRWLDIGCGAGTYSRLLEGQGLDVVGIDYSVPTLFKARDRSPSSIAWLAADATRLPIRSASCDGALCFGVLQAIPDSAAALRSIADALKPGGVLWVDALNGRCVPNALAIRARRRAGKTLHLRYETADELVRTLTIAGFDRIRVHWAAIVPTRVQWLQPLAESAPTRWLFEHGSGIAARLCHSILIEARRANGSSL